MKRLAVYLNSEKVGILEQDDSGLLIFRYDEVWLEKPDAMSLSRSLPLQPDAFKGKEARAFFAGILPDAGPREIVAAILGISERNDFAMLERIGGECAGAVSLYPEDDVPPQSKEPSYRELSETELKDILDELPRRPLMAGKEGVRLSLAGAQDKLPVFLRDNQICLPLADTPSTHILKPEPDRFDGLAANETLCMSLAKVVGLSVPDVAYRIIGTKPCMLVKRYDRLVDDNGIMRRLHQEDFCQAMGFPPERKYQQEGGPLVRDCIALLRDWSTIPVLDIRDFIDGLIFNILIGNADAHGKNYSILYAGDGRRLAPFYDLVCTMAWDDLSKIPAMKIGGCKTMETVTSSNWKRMSEESRLGWPMVRDRIIELSQRVLDHLGPLQNCLDRLNPLLVKRTGEFISSRAKSMLKTVEENGK